MKMKSNFFVFLIIICILFSISVASVSSAASVSPGGSAVSDASVLLDASAASASDGQADILNGYDNCQLDIEQKQDSDYETICESYDGDLNQDSLSFGLDDEVSNQDSSSDVLKDESTSFRKLHEEINQSEGEFNLSHSYVYDENDDYEFGDYQIGTLVINGNNNALDGNNSEFCFDFSLFIDESLNSEKRYFNLIINDLTFANYRNTVLKFNEGNLTLNNVNFTNCSTELSSLIALEKCISLTLNNCNFYSNSLYHHLEAKELRVMICNSNFLGNNCTESAIELNRGQIFVENSSFENFNAKHGSIINYKGDTFEIRNSKFLNSHANSTGGAIIAKFFPLYEDLGNNSYIFFTPDNMIIENCTFSNLSSTSNGGAIHLDLDSGSYRVAQSLNVTSSNFTDCSSKFGGAISIIGGNLNIRDSRFESNRASFEGGAIYSSWTNLSISGSLFNGNVGDENAGVLYFDKGKLTIEGSSFISNKALKSSEKMANAIYAYDVNADFKDSSFDNGGVSVYADFASDSKLTNIEKNNDIFLMDNHNYIVSVETPGIKFNLTGNEIFVDKLPSKFDAREWGWTTPGKVQGDNDDCWAFATIASIETALGKSTGVLYNLSQNYVQKLQLKYFYAGDLRNSLTGFSHSGLGYALSWYGVLPMDMDYDDRGMIADTDLELERIHVQDAMFIYTGLDDTVDMLKRAIMKYGAVTVQYYVFEPEGPVPTEGDDIAIMDHATHFISLIGWDDNYVVEGEEPSDDPQENFIWITKDSLTGYTQIPYDIFSNIDYYAIVPQRVAVAYIFENTIDYHVNYQTDLTGLAGFDENYRFYSNEFSSKYDELIGAVGTYFNEAGISYSFDVYVNGVKAHTQTGVSEFAGFRTIILDKYIPIKTGDHFKVVFKSNSVPYQAWSRVHYLNGTSLVSADGGNWVDMAPLNKTVCLKVYTVADDTKMVDNRDMVVDYDGGSYFSVRVVTADGRAVGPGESVAFAINGKTTTVKTDYDGIAKILITELPGTYEITTTYRGQSYKNTVTVKQVLTTTAFSVKNTDKSLILKATLKINGNPVEGKVITFTFRGKTYKAKTNKNGVAQVTIKQSAFKNLNGKAYVVKISYGKDTIKTNVAIKQILKANKVTIKKKAKKFYLKATLKINSKAAKGKTIKFKFRGKTYSAKTNKKGLAKVTIKRNVIKKLKKGKTYAVTVSYGKDTFKTTVKVKK